MERTSPADWALHVVGRIYETVEKPDAWDAVLLKISDRLAGASVSLMVTAFPQTRPVRAWLQRMDPSALVEYETTYAAIDTLLAAGLSSVPPGTVASFEDACPRSVYSRMPVYNEFYVRRGFGEGLAMFLQPSPERAAVLACYRPSTSGPFDEHELRDIGLLVPHVSRALQASWRLMESDARSQVLTAGMDHLRAGVLLVSGAGRVLHANARAREILAERDGLSADRNLGGGLELHALSAQDNDRLGTLLRRACRTGQGEGSSSGGVCLVSRPSLEAPYQVMVVPNSSASENWMVAAPVAALVFVLDSSLEPAGAEGRLKQLYGLTPAESRLAVRLLAGDSPEEAARALGIRIATVRTQIRFLLAKTGASRFSNLVLLFASGVANTLG